MDIERYGEIAVETLNASVFDPNLLDVSDTPPEGDNHHPQCACARCYSDYDNEI